MTSMAMFTVKIHQTSYVSHY